MKVFIGTFFSLIFIASQIGFAGALMPKPKTVVSFQSTTPNTQITGEAVLTETKDGLEVKVSLKGVPEGEHGFHIHENASCADQGNAAGSHFDPDHVTHGNLEKDGFSHAHAGDFGNIVADEKGHAKLHLTLPQLNLTLKNQYTVAGRSMILHEHKDDFGQPTGNAGGRIACGLIPEV